MRAREKIVLASSESISSWWRFAAGAGLFVAVVTGLDLGNTLGGPSIAEQLLPSLLFAAMLLVCAGAAASLMWLGVRAVRGKDDAPAFRDSVLWNACLAGGLVMALRMMQ